jgi:hypothetical protein
MSEIEFMPCEYPLDMWKVKRHHPEMFGSHKTRLSSRTLVTCWEIAPERREEFDGALKRLRVRLGLFAGTPDAKKQATTRNLGTNAKKSMAAGRT